MAPDSAQPQTDARTVSWRLRRGPFFVLLILFAALSYQISVFVLEHWGAPAAQASSRPYRVGEVAGAERVSQTMVANAAGLEAIEVRAERFGDDVEGIVVFELSELDDEASQAVYRIVKPVVDVVAGPSYTIRFPPIERSRGREYRLEIAMPATPFGKGIALWAEKENTYREGALFVGEREQWGDLVFSTSARGANVVNRIAGGSGARSTKLGSPWMLAAVFLLFNVGLGVFVWEAMRLDTSTGADAGRAASWSAIAVVAVVVMLVGTAGSIRRGLTSREEVIVDLIEQFPDATKLTTFPKLHDAFDIVDVNILGDTKRSIFAHPVTRILWTIDVPPDARLRTSAALRQDVWDREGDGVIFRVGISEGGDYKEVFRRSLSPYKFGEDRRWVPISADLGPYAGKRVQVVFNTEVGEFGNGVNDAAVWGEPRIVKR